MKIKFEPENTNFRFEVSLLGFFFCALYIYQLPPLIEPCVVKGEPFQFGFLFRLVIYPAFYVLLNLVFWFILKKQIVFRAIIAVFLGVIMAIIRVIEAPGIIDPVYFFILSASYAAVLGAYRGDYFHDQLKKVNEFNDITEKMIDYIRDGYKYILGKAFQGWLGLGASLGVSMSILFRSGYEEPHLKFMALKMLIGFIAISAAVGFWVGIPILNGIVNLQEHLLSLKLEKDQEMPKA